MLINYFDTIFYHQVKQLLVGHLKERPSIDPLKILLSLYRANQLERQVYRTKSYFFRLDHCSAQLTPFLRKVLAISTNYLHNMLNSVPMRWDDCSHILV